MSWSYSGDPSASPRDLVRFHIGDTTQAPNSLTDQEIDYLLSEANGEAGAAAADAADLWAGRFAGLSASSKSIGDLSIAQDYAGAANRLYDTGRRLRARHGGISGALIFDTTPGIFGVGMDDNGAGGSDSFARYF